MLRVAFLLICVVQPHILVSAYDVSDESAVGCFRDKGNQRDLPKLAYSGRNSPQLCKAACQQLGFKYAGVQYSSECWCGNSYGKHGRSDHCELRCEGNNRLFCGGVWANCVYDKNSIVGCFLDKVKRDLPKLAYSGRNSGEHCMAACKRLGYKYSGVQYSKECWCGNSYGKYGRADNCQRRCEGNNSKFCGGVWSNFVYKAGDSPKPAPMPAPMPAPKPAPKKADEGTGCFQDKPNRDLPKQAYSGRNSPQLCKAACKRLGYKYAGVQYSSQCWCGYSSGKYGPAKNCNMQCTKNSGQLCGGTWANNIHVADNSVIGCFRDRPNRDLPKHAALTGANSGQLCKAACKQLGFKYAGVQYSSQCFCGNSYGKYGPAGNCM